MKKVIIPLLLISTAIMNPFSTWAQEARLATLDELVSGGESYRFVKNIYGLQWWGDVLIKPDIDKITAIYPKSGHEEKLLSLEDINSALSKNGLGHIATLQGLKFPWADKKECLVTLGGKLVALDFQNEVVVDIKSLRPGAENQDYEPISHNVAYTIGHDLYVNDTAVTSEPEGVVSGQSVHRNEFGISKGTFWSPDGSQLAFYRMDERMVTEYPLVDITTRIATVTPVRYPMAGMTSHMVTVGVYDVNSGKTHFLDFGDPTDRYFTNISWSPDGKSIYLIELNRDQNHSKLCRYNAASGKLEKILLEEQHEKYVEPQNPVTFLPWDENKMVYISQKDGFRHMYLIDTDGNELRQLTRGQWVVQQLIGFNPQRKELIYSSTEVSPLQCNIFKIQVEKGTKTALDNQEGLHQALLSKTGNYMTDVWSSPQMPRSVNYSATTAKAKAVNILTAEDPFKDYAMPSIEIGTLKAADGKTDLYYRITKPHDFNPGKKYPVIVYVYGGPHAHNIDAGWRYSIRSWDLYMANKGYIIFTVDGRGSENRGLEFENATFRHLGVEECKDQVKGVELLQKLPYVDRNRIGVYGWSFGGHMATALMLRYPDIFKVGVAGGPVIDWSYYEVMYGERYMDTPQTNPDGYRECDLRNLAGNLKGHLLMIHGYQDETCVPQHTLSFMKACITAKVYPDLFLYPGHQHGVRGVDNVHLQNKIANYFIDNL